VRVCARMGGTCVRTNGGADGVPLLTLIDVTWHGVAWH
jgi:hypothetical protein